MNDDAIAAAHERSAEQLMSDERLLGVLPEDATDLLLRWALDRLDAAAVEAPDPEAFAARADAIHREARAVADDAAATGGDAATLAERLGMAYPGAPAPDSDVEEPEAVPPEAPDTPDDRHVIDRAVPDEAASDDNAVAPGGSASGSGSAGEASSALTAAVGSLVKRVRGFFRLDSRRSRACRGGDA